MAKDWESFKDEYIDNVVEDILDKFKSLERNIESPIERIMHAMLYWRFDWALHQMRMDIKRQEKIGRYTVDFLVTYNLNSGEVLKFVIECDGHDYHERTKKQATHDKKRDRYFTENDYIVLRYTGSEIVKDPFMLLDSVDEIICKREGAA